jgi:hypothetical protein
MRGSGLDYGFPRSAAAAGAVWGGRCIAVVGARNVPHEYGNIIVKDFAAKGYPVLPVNPREKEIASLPAYPDLASVPGPVDLAKVITPPGITRGILAEAARSPAASADPSPAGLRAPMVPFPFPFRVRRHVFCRRLS